MLTTSPVVVSNIANTCWRASKSHPIILISASFGPSTVRANTEQFTRAVARPASLWHQRNPTGMHRSAAEPVTGTTICRHYREDYKYCASQQYAAAAVAVGLEFLGSVEVLDQHEIASELVE